MAKKKAAAKKHRKHKHLVLKKTKSGKLRWVSPKKKAKVKGEVAASLIKRAVHAVKGGGTKTWHMPTGDTHTVYPHKDSKKAFVHTTPAKPPKPPKKPS